MKKFFLAVLFISFCTFLYNQSFDRFDDRTSNKKTFLDVLKWRKNSTPGFWPDFVKMSIYSELPNKALENQIVYINHSSFLLRSRNYNILFDPIYSEYASPVSFAGPKRVHDPILPYNLLPNIDYVLISHNHYDHMDLPTLRRLWKDHDPIFLVGLNTKKYLRSKIDSDIKIFELDWGEKISSDNLNIYFEEAKHWSKRSLFDNNYMLWGSFVLELNDKLIYHAGDTGYGDHFLEMNKKYGDFDFAMLPIGDYEPRWFMKDSHMNPLEAFQAFKDLKASMAVGMHFNTFQLADNSFYQVQDDFLKAASENPNSDFRIPLKEFVFNF